MGGPDGWTCRVQKKPPTTSRLVPHAARIPLAIKRGIQMLPALLPIHCSTDNLENVQASYKTGQLQNNANSNTPRRLIAADGR